LPSPVTPPPQRAADADPISSLSQLLLTRKQVAHLLGGIDISTIRRLEREGTLKPLRLSRSSTGMVFFAARDVDRLVTSMQAAAE
jgi:DNA-binding transcriptional MerR regulator